MNNIGEEIHAMFSTRRLTLCEAAKFFILVAAAGERANERGFVH